MTSVKSFTVGINRVLSKNGGVMWEKLHDMQLRQFLINELEKSDCSCRKKAALVIGKQPESDVYVFSESVQVRVNYINNKLWKVHVQHVNVYVLLNFSFPLF